jgi:hypothetical protein
VTPGPTRTSRRQTAIPVFTYVTEPGVPPVFVMRLGKEALRRVEAHAHTHDFPGLVYFERSAGALTFRGRETPIRAGDAYLIGQAAVVDVVADSEWLVQARGSGVFFTPRCTRGVRSGRFRTRLAHTSTAARLRARERRRGSPDPRPT